jgi:hypothetical protein
MAKRIRTVTSPHTKHTSWDGTYTTLQHTKQTTKLLLRARAIFPASSLRGVVIPHHKISLAVRLLVRLLMAPGHQFTQRNAVYFQGKGWRQERYNETALSEAGDTYIYIYIYMCVCVYIPLIYAVPYYICILFIMFLFSIYIIICTSLTVDGIENICW